MVVKFRKNRFGGNKMVEPPRDEKSTRKRADRDQWKHTLGNARTKLMLEMEEFAFPMGDPPFNAPGAPRTLVDMLETMVKLGASDLHLKAGFPAFIRLLDTEIYPFEFMDPLDDEEIFAFVEELISPERYRKYRETGDADFATSFLGGERFRINAYIAMDRPSMAIRHIKSKIPSMQELGLPWVISKFAHKNRGLILVTGPTGSGKSTTLASIIEDINARRRCHIVTLEDPIEYVFTPNKAVIDQREIGRDSVSFHEALRRVFRQDPDVIMVGEMRDLETISSAITAAETGHLVLATLHTQDAPGTIDRIIDIFPPHQQNQIRTQLANILVGICSQQLLTTTDNKRVLATEVLVANYAVRNLIKEGKPQQIRNIMATCTSEGMMLMEHSLASLCKKGKITRETAFLHAFDVKDLERFLEEK